MSSSFFHMLHGGAYDRALGWFCHPLTVTGATVEELRLQGSAISPDLYKVDPPYIRLLAPPAPDVPDATIKIRIRENKKLDASIWVALIGLVGVITVPLITVWNERSREAAMKPSGSTDVGATTATVGARPVAASAPPGSGTSEQTAQGPRRNEAMRTVKPASAEIEKRPAPQKPPPSEERVAKSQASDAPTTAASPIPAYQEAVRMKEAGNFAPALEIFKRLAEGGNPKAQYQLGNMYLHGLGVSKDAAKAASWLQRAADAQVAQAQHNLGVMYQRGDGVPKDDKRSIDLFTAAARNGWEPSKAMLTEAGRSW